MALRALFDVAAPAKLNLFLHVIGRRDDGYHLLQSVFVLIDWCDTLHFELRGDGRLARHDLGAPLPTDDLCLRAARALQTESGCTLGADISIDKVVPSGAGMGGGSSDAASCLLALNRLWRLQWSKQRLMQLGLTLGADVPFFVGGENAFVEGIGDRITALAALPTQHFAVVKPPASIDTRSIFASPQLSRDTPALILAGFLEAAPFAVEGGLFARGRNDLQPVAEQHCDEVGSALSWLAGRCGNARMTGSGSAVFAWLDAVGEVVQAGEGGLFDQLPDGWNGRICSSLAKHPLADWAEG